MDDAQVMCGIALDDTFEVVRVMARGTGGTTELVRPAGAPDAAPLVRKKIARELANRRVWATVADIGCSRLPQVVCTYELPDSFVVVYAYVEGQSVSELVRRSNVAFSYAPEEAARIVCEVAEAAGALHEAGVVHRDITPSNVIVAADGAHLLDLGIARVHDPAAARDTTFLGTKGFAAPEQYGFGQTDARSDVYSMGCLLDYLLWGEPAFEGGVSPIGLPAARALGQVATRARSFEPSARYQSAAEFADAVRAALAAPGSAPDGAPDPGVAVARGQSGAHPDPGVDPAHVPSTSGPSADAGPGAASADPSRGPAQAPTPPSRTLLDRLARAKDDWFDGLRHASQARTIAAILVLVVCGALPGLLFVWVAVDLVLEGQLTSGLFGLAWGLAIAYALGYELSCAILGAGDYADHNVVGRYLLRVAKCAAAFALVFLVLFVINVAFGV